MKITVLGTGLMGTPMARRLAAAGHDIHVWNRSKTRADALSDIATIHATPQNAVQDAEVVIAMLIDGPITTDVLLRQSVFETLTRGTLVLNMGSVDPATDRIIARKAHEIGLRYLDAPVSGGVAGAEAGTLAILVGGDRVDFMAAGEVFATLGRATHLGPSGAGQVAKLANQLIVATTIGAVAEAFRLAQSAGCDAAALRNALMGGFADSRILELHGARMVAGDFQPGGRSVAQLKDLDNAMDVAQAAGLYLPLGATVTAAFRDFVDYHNGAEMDHSAYYLWLEHRASK